jgi:cell shape-determining protein MreC
MNLFIGIMVSAISNAQEMKDANEKESENSVNREILEELKSLRAEIEQLKKDRSDISCEK